MSSAHLKRNSIHRPSPPTEGGREMRALKEERAPVMSLEEINKVIVSRGCLPLESLGTRDGWKIWGIAPDPALRCDYFLYHKFYATSPWGDDRTYLMKDAGPGCLLIPVVTAPCKDDILVVMVRQSRATLEGRYLSELPRAGTPPGAELASLAGYGQKDERRDETSSRIISLSEWRQKQRLREAGLPPGLKNLVDRELGPLVDAGISSRRIISLGKYPEDTGTSRVFVHAYVFELDVGAERLRTIQGTGDWQLRYHTLGDIRAHLDELSADPHSSIAFLRYFAYLDAQRRGVGQETKNRHTA